MFPNQNGKNRRLKMTDLDKHIRCKCGKHWGMHNHKRNCKRCKTPVIARGEIPKKELTIA